MANIQEQPPRPDQAPNIPEARRKLEYVQIAQNTMVCVGLDSEYAQIPAHIKSSSISRIPIPLSVSDEERTILNFNTPLFEATNDLICAYKPNIGFYEAQGNSGLNALERTIGHIRDQRPDILTILDFKKGDIGNTNRNFIRTAFDYFQADAVTVNGWSGSAYLKDGKMVLGSMEPFLSQKDKLIFIWNKSSNEDGGEWQDMPVSVNRMPRVWNEKFGDLSELSEILEQTGVAKELKSDEVGYKEGDVPLFLVMAYKQARDWNPYGNVGLVVGATYPRELSWVRKVVGDVPILVPGLGAQEGDAQRTIDGGVDSNGRGLIINASRSLIFASKGEDFAQAARNATQALRDQINAYRAAA